MNTGEAAVLVGKGVDAVREHIAGRDGRTLCYATTVVDHGDSVGIVQYGSEIITMYDNGDIRLDSRGWRTVTTKKRLNWVARIWQDKGEWYFYWPSVDWPWEETSAHVFTDGIVLHPDGRVSGGLGEGEVEERAKLRKKAVKYAREFTKKLIAGEIPKPSAGDCWYCSMHVVDTGEPLGEVSSNDHIVHHIEQEYYVPSLVHNAIKRFPVSSFAEGVLYALWYDETGEHAGVLDRWGTGISGRQIGSSIRRYVLSQLGMA